MLPVYSAGETSVQDFSPARLAADLTRRFGVRSIACDSFEAATASVLRNLKPPAVVLTVGAGDVWKAARQLRDQLE
jgi:UDP-N-acetylmuramate-alanine ligase